MPKPGDLFTNVKLAETYERILRECEGGTREQEIERARKAWSQGFVAEAIDRYCRTEAVFDVTGQHNRGVLTGQDMATWTATVEAPIHYDYGRYRVFKPSTWSQGLACLQQLALLKGFDLDGIDVAGPDFVHLVTEAAKLAFADREAFYGDPAFVDVPIETLLSEAYNAERRKLIGDTASLELRPGTIAGAGGKVDARVASGKRVAVGATGAGEPTVGDIDTDPNGVTRGDTVHFDIIDRWGNMVSSTPSGVV